MSLIETNLRNGQTQMLQAVGRYLMLKEGVLITAIVGEKSVVMPRGYVFDMGEEFTQLTVTNESDIEAIEIMTSVIPFVAGVDGSQLAINADLQIKDGLAVRFDAPQAVTLPVNQQVRAELTNLPNVLAVEVQNMPEAKEVQKVHVVEQSQPNLRYVAHETMTTTGTITGNVKRKELILKAGAGNQATIWLGGVAERGFELAPDGGFILSNGAELEVLIPANCKLYVSEVTA
ncbi:hypothetical protein [Vibrio scophthalmi]|uniref:Uncharacterized protein n=1 Tax=Vibrio scophthalmi TaxID=45658 RepID=A0A1E3WMY9_9VIBR|nr:hypothetical protein [Vibrio scophthalmi]ODS05209.1 hypothetical protein VSF3289_04350 [Vibrio scophthalmi]ODS10342.1 hypothetical protein VSF3289_00597 [Vibrio scophthalmi]ODS12588.1 hypothetical protein VSF3289_02913 [Vibrio scophthalmi]